MAVTLHSDSDSDSDSDAGSEVDSSDVDDVSPRLLVHGGLDKPVSVSVSAPLSSLIDSIPLEDRGLVGRRRLVKRKDLDGEDGDEDGDGEMTLEEQIEADRVQIEKAAGRLGCKRAWVTGSRREEVDERGEVVAAGRVESSPDGEEEEEGSGKGKVEEVSGEDDKDMVLRRPGDDPPLKHKSKTKDKGKGKQKASEEGVNDDMEWIQGAQLGQRDKGRMFRDVETKKLRWRVPGMHTPLLDHQVLGVDFMVDHEMAKKRPRGGLVADAMGLGKVCFSVRGFLPAGADGWADYPVYRDDGVESCAAGG